MPNGGASLPGNSGCTIGDAGHVESGAEAVTNGVLIMLYGTSVTTLTSMSGDSSYHDGHGVSCHINVLDDSSRPDVLGGSDSAYSGA